MKHIDYQIAYIEVKVINIMKYVALLRGINSGKNPMLKMEVLRNAFEKMGFENIKTVIASGNVIFETNKVGQKSLEEKIEKELPKYIGFQSSTIVRTIGDIEKLVVDNPFKHISASSKSRLYVTFVKDSSKRIGKIEAQGFTIIKTFPGAICYTIDESTRTPDVMGLLGKEIGKDITTRNWNTIGRILKTSTS